MSDRHKGHEFFPHSFPVPTNTFVTQSRQYLCLHDITTVAEESSDSIQIGQSESEQEDTVEDMLLFHIKESNAKNEFNFFFYLWPPPIQNDFIYSQKYMRVECKLFMICEKLNSNSKI